MKTEKLILIGGDLIALLVIVWLGRLSHTQDIFDIGAWLFTASPFLISWFVVIPWLGLYQPTIVTNWQAWLPRLLLGWGLIGLPIGLMLRSLFLGRPVIAGIMPTFALVMLLTTSTALIAWRFGYQWFYRRKLAANIS